MHEHTKKSDGIGFEENLFSSLLPGTQHFVNSYLKMTKPSEFRYVRNWYQASTRTAIKLVLFGWMCSVRRWKNEKCGIFIFYFGVKKILTIISKCNNIFFDMKKAFDKVWRQGLLSNLCNLNVPKAFVQWIRGFFQSRTIQVKINNFIGKKFFLKEGVP